MPANPTPTPPTPLQVLKDAKKKATQANKAYDAAADLLTKASAAKAQAEDTMNQALSAKIAAAQALEEAFKNFRDGPDEA